MASFTFRNDIFTKRPEDFIMHAMTEAQIDRFWQSSAMTWLRQVMAGNAHFVSHVAEVTIMANKLGYCERLTASVDVCLPDNGQTINKVITYSFDRKKHKVAIN